MITAQGGPLTGKRIVRGREAECADHYQVQWYERLSGKGMPRVRGKGKGDLFVAVEVRSPTNLTPRQRELLEEFAKLEDKRTPGGSS